MNARLPPRIPELTTAIIYRVSQRRRIDPSAGEPVTTNHERRPRGSGEILEVIGQICAGQRQKAPNEYITDTNASILAASEMPRQVLAAINMSYCYN
jgi:hypothetical protein